MFNNIIKFLINKVVVLNSFKLILIPLLLLNTIIISSAEYCHETINSTNVSENVDTLCVSHMHNIQPGDIISIRFSDSHPISGKPVMILVTLKGNPYGESFEETLSISDRYEGLVVNSQGVGWETGETLVYQTLLHIGKRKSYTHMIMWYPVLTGNHTLKFQAGIFSIKYRNISVNFDTQNIIYPSMGTPAIIDKNSFEKLAIVVSEERQLSENPLSVQHAELEAIDGSATYGLHNGSIVFSKWVYCDRKHVEDEFMINYNVSNIPCGFYNISITTSKNIYKWPHAVKIIHEEPKDYRFLHITDIHIGKSYNLVDERKIFEKIIQYINDVLKPDFVIISGDLVDWCKTKHGHNLWMEFHKLVLKCRSPIFTTPGNHDRYENGLYMFYIPYFNLSYYHMYVTPLDNYAFIYGNINFVLMDSGYDWSRWEIKPHLWNPTPEASGFTNMQMYLLENMFGDNTRSQIIVMHHPAVNDIDDIGLFRVPDNHPSGNDQCIAFNRIDFINYCRNNNVSLVLSGHTHKNHVFNYTGRIPTSLHEYPLFIQTTSATLNMIPRGRIIEVKNGHVQSYDAYRLLN
ncbi:MAG: hypothetical protein DRN08_04965 [Thermoplasmata archaeon]|nr:MAG: hypothetical protein DRN05_00840 [Thermoplasmata archaeon]RLF34081.1 MAG: hypothetical protein DRN08_04965 [Thermoplasmata archaeon]